MKDLVKRRKSEVRYCEVLKNGQFLNVFFWRNQAIILGENIITWQVGVVISETRKQAKKWFLSPKNPYDSKSTGRCGLEGIKRAAEIILDFRDSMKINEMLFVGFEDFKRQSAYRRLKKYGFKEYEENGAVRYYASPNLIDRKWVEE